MDLLYQGGRKGFNDDDGDDSNNTSIDGSLISHRPFTMMVNFNDGSGRINKDSAASNLVANEYDLEGNFTVDLTNGTFAGDSLKIKRHTDSTDGSGLDAKLYGTFHGSTGEGGNRGLS